MVPNISSYVFNHCTAASYDSDFAYLWYWSFPDFLLMAKDAMTQRGRDGSERGDLKIQFSHKLLCPNSKHVLWPTAVDWTYFAVFPPKSTYLKSLVGLHCSYLYGAFLPCHPMHATACLFGDLVSGANCHLMNQRWKRQCVTTRL